MIEHPEWSPAELHQMRVMRDRLNRGNGHVTLTRPPNRAEQFAIDEWERDFGKRERPERIRQPGETYIHWPLGAVSKGYVALMLGLVVLITVMGLAGGLPEATPEQRRPFYDRYLEPIFGKSPWERAKEERTRAAAMAEYERRTAAGEDAPLPIMPVEPMASSPSR